MCSSVNLEMGLLEKTLGASGNGACVALLGLAGLDGSVLSLDGSHVLHLGVVVDIALGLRNGGPCGLAGQWQSSLRNGLGFGLDRPHQGVHIRGKVGVCTRGRACRHFAVDGRRRPHAVVLERKGSKGRTVLVLDHGALHIRNQSIESFTDVGQALMGFLRCMILVLGHLRILRVGGNHLLIVGGLHLIVLESIGLICHKAVHTSMAIRRHVEIKVGHHHSLGGSSGRGCSRAHVVGDQARNVHGRLLGWIVTMPPDHRR